MIENNKRIVERSRTQVGNLAHSLKTPLAVMLNEGRSLGGDKGRLIVDQASAMQTQVEHYLQRARVAAQRDSVVYRTPVGATLKRMVRVIEKLNPRTAVTLAAAGRGSGVRGRARGSRGDRRQPPRQRHEVGEEQGDRVGTTEPGGDPASGMFALTIEDDGPGIPEDKAREALKRGKRLDETKPGSGLGLAIVSDLVNEYSGKLALERSSLGGLRAIVRLRRTE